MKKIMVLVAAVAMAVCASAASFNWEFTKDTTYKYGTIYVIDGVDYNNVVALLDKGGADVASAFKGYVKGSSSVARAGTANGLGAGITMDSTTKEGSAAFLIFKQDVEVADGSSYAMTDVIDVSDYLYEGTEVKDGLLTLETANFAKSGTIGSGGPTPVPEPTSGLLLLVGGSLLALRRRR